MADYRGGGGAGGGASVVPASFVVASDREDYPLTEAGLAAAIAALPAEGGEIWVGQGTITLTGSITIDRNVKLIGAGRATTVITPAASVTAFSLGAFQLVMRDMEFRGNGTQKLILLTAAGSVTDLQNVRVGGIVGGFGGTPLDTFLDASGSSFGGSVRLTDSDFNLDNVFIANGNTLSLSMEMCNVGALTSISLPGSASQNGAYNCSFSAATIEVRAIPVSGCLFSGNVTFVGGTFADGCTVTATTITFGNNCKATNCSLTGAVTTGDNCQISNATLTSTLSAGETSIYSNCVIAGAVTAGGTGVKMFGCKLASFTSSTAGRDNHVIKGCTFTGAGNNCTLTDSDGCVVEGNVNCQVNETATSDSNVFANNTGFSGSTIVGPNDTVDGTRRFSSTGNSADAYATILTFTSLKGLFGIGTIKNTDGAADQMTVEEEAIDFFGTTHTKETVVSAAGDYLLSPQTNFSAAGGPPYSSYRVRVKSTSAGNPAPYSIQFAAQGVPS